MKQKIKDNLIYLCVGLAIAAAFTIYMFYVERTTGRIQQIPGPILWGILSTPGIVALILERFWEYRRRRLLWLILVGTMSINVLAMYIAYFFRWDPPVIVWSALTVPCVIVAFIAGERFVVRKRSG